jgi:hypothetical protein
MLHIIFNLPDRTLFEEVQQLDESLQGPVWVIRDDFSVGPVTQLDTSEGRAARLNWWKSCYEKSAYKEIPTPDFDDNATVEQIKNWLIENPSDSCWIWMAQNQHDVAGYFWLIGQLTEFQVRVMVLYLNNLPFINEKGQLFYPNWLSEIPIREFLKAKKLARPVTTSEFEIDPDEWKKLAEESKVIRVLEGGKKLTSKDDNYFDAELKKFITNDWQRVNRILANAQGKMKVKTGDVFLMSRLWEMVHTGFLELNGNWDRGWKETEIRKLLSDTVSELEVK